MITWSSIALPLVPAAVMAFSDFRERRISVTALAAYGTCCAFSSVMLSGWRLAMRGFLFGAAVILMLLAALLLFYRIRYGREKAVIDHAFGMGDILFLICTAMLLDAVRLCLFIVIACVAGIVWHRATGKEEIPFVGLAVPVLAVFLSLNVILP